MQTQIGMIFRAVLAATSPAVVVPSMLEIAANGYGTGEGIPTLLIAAGSIDNVYAITLFSIFLAIVFAQGSRILTSF